MYRNVIIINYYKITFSWQTLTDDFDAPKTMKDNLKQPKLIYHHDSMTRRLDHLQPIDGFDPHKAELQMLMKLPISDVYNWSGLSSRLSKERAARLHELVHFCATGGLTQAGRLHFWKLSSWWNLAHPFWQIRKSYIFRVSTGLGNFERLYVLEFEHWNSSWLPEGHTSSYCKHSFNTTLQLHTLNTPS